MTWLKDTARTIDDNATEYRESVEGVALAAIDVVRDTTLLMVPLSLALTPQKERIIPVADRAVEMWFDTTSKVVKAGYAQANALSHRAAGLVP